MTLTQTRAVDRSGAVSTSVMVTKPMRGSWTSRARISPISWRSGWSMRSVRWVMRALSSPIAVGAGRLGDGRSRDRLDGEALEHVALDDVGGRGEADAALEA